jgi:hypothetical protein
MVIIENVTREDAIERILTYLSLSEIDEQINVEPIDWQYWDVQAKKKISEWQKLRLRYFDGAQPYAYLSLMFLTETYTRYVFDPEDPEIHSLPLTSWDVSTLGVDQEGPGVAKQLGKQYLYTLQRVRKVPLKEVRGLFRPLTGDVVEVSQAMLFSDGKYVTERVYCERRAGRWTEVAVPYEIHPVPCNDVMNNSIWMHKSIALTTEYDWQIHLAYNLSDLPSIALACDPLGAKDVFKLRDVPKGKSRREALRNWVSGHWRKVNPPDHPEIHIWPYIRGAEEFTWNGLYCKIQPSAYDLRQAAKYQQSSEAEKKCRSRKR